MINDRGKPNNNTIEISITTMGIITITIAAITLTSLSFTTAIAQQGSRTGQQQQDIELMVQNTSMSVPAPNAS
jgi:hypothetical protein